MLGVIVTGCLVSGRIEACGTLVRFFFFYRGVFTLTLGINFCRIFLFFLLFYVILLVVVVLYYVGLGLGSSLVLELFFLVLLRIS